MELHAAEESFNNDQRFVRRFLDGTLQIEHFLPLPKAGGEFVFWRAFGRITRPATGVGDQFAFGVVNRNDDAADHQTLVAGEIAKTEINDGFLADAAFRKIRMQAIQFLQPEFQGRIGRVVLRLGRRCRC